MINFKSEDEFNIAGRGRVFSVKNPIPPTENVWVDDYSFLLDSKVKIDGKEFYVKGVECYSYGGPRRMGDNIGLLAK